MTGIFHPMGSTFYKCGYSYTNGECVDGVRWCAFTAEKSGDGRWFWNRDVPRDADFLELWMRKNGGGEILGL